MTEPQKEMNAANQAVINPSSDRLKARRKFRHLLDKSASVGIAIGGVSVIVAILLIFFYLFYEVAPLFRSAEIEQRGEFTLPASESELLHIAVEEQSQLAMRLGSQGDLVFFKVADGELVERHLLPIPESETITSFALDTEESGQFAVGTDAGNAYIAQYGYDTSYGTNNERILTPAVEFPFGEDAFELSSSALSHLSLRASGDNLLISANDATNSVSLVRITKQTSLLSAFSGGGGSFTQEPVNVTINSVNLNYLFIEESQRWLYLIENSGVVSVVDINSGETMEAVDLSTGEGEITDISFLLGGLSLLVANDQGLVAQWFLVKEEDTTRLEKVRIFETSSEAVTDLTAEQRRKNFLTIDNSGSVGIYNTTAHREVLRQPLFAGMPNKTPLAAALSPRGDTLLVVTQDNGVSVWEVHNEHPEVSVAALWNKVWYESYDEPAYVWQSSSASNDFEPKYSLTPLAFGTLKAAFYAMLLATPLAICGAIFTGYFMAPAMRRKVKPLIELMEALPTVVLGFLAGLWLAPFVEKNLLGVFAILIILPLSILLASFAWMRMPARIRHKLADGWEAALLLPVIILFGYLSFVIAAPVESVFFGGDLRFWISEELGISYDQRNAMVVGFAMGFAVIPTIFSIAEDAIFTVPKQLTYGSLALGATPWQSLYRVVLPTASPGIFSGLMIGFGRAVGETMIVLMATGNTPIMDINIFEGMRTLAANIAVEIPESEVDSTHYRILFLAALVLFMFTFVFNSIAEIVRQRLRTKYSTI